MFIGGMKRITPVEIEFGILLGLTVAALLYGFSAAIFG
jgi:hypothetical protein